MSDTPMLSEPEKERMVDFCADDPLWKKYELVDEAFSRGMGSHGLELWCIFKRIGEDELWAFFYVRTSEESDFDNCRDCFRVTAEEQWVTVFEKQEPTP